MSNFKQKVTSSSLVVMLLVMGAFPHAANATGLQSVRAKDEPLVVEDSGFGQKEKTVGFAFTVKNSNEGQAVGRSEYQIAFYDESDTVVETETGYIELILPAQTIGVAGTKYLDDGITVKRIEVQLSDGTLEDSSPGPEIDVSKVTYWPGDISTSATALIKNPYKVDLDDLYVYAVAYDAKGAIIGGGFTFLGFLPASGQIGVEVPITSSDEPARVAIFPTFSIFSTSKTDKSSVKPIELVAQGNSKKGDRIGYAFIVNNPNAKMAIEDSRYQVTAYDADGRVLETDSGYVGALFPGQKFGIGDSLYLPKDTKIDKLVVQVKTGKAIETSATFPFSTTKVVFKDDRYFPKITGLVKNTHKKKLENVPVYGVAYDAKGVIIGGGFTYVNFVPANGQSPVEVQMTVEAKPAKVELFPVISDLDDLKK